MKRTFATLGVVGLGLLSMTAPAMAASDRVIVCHAGGTGATVWEPLEFSVNGIGGHAQHPTDIIPPTPKAPTGLNWTNAGKITYIASCAAASGRGATGLPARGRGPAGRRTARGGPTRGRPAGRRPASSGTASG
jgi:hypothetical protein